MLISQNNYDIYTLLEKNNKLPISFNSDSVIVFEKNDNFYVTCYNAETKNFILLTAENYLNNKNELIELISEMQNLNDLNLLSQKTIQIIENIIHSKSCSGLYFDAH